MENCCLFEFLQCLLATADLIDQIYHAHGQPLLTVSCPVDNSGDFEVNHLAMPLWQDCTENCANLLSSVIKWHSPCRLVTNQQLALVTSRRSLIDSVTESRSSRGVCSASNGTFSIGKLLMILENYASILIMSDLVRTPPNSSIRKSILWICAVFGDQNSGGHQNCAKWCALEKKLFNLQSDIMSLPRLESADCASTL